MSDLLLVGHAPSSPEGQEFFLHCMDWWWDIYHLIERLLSDSYPVDVFFFPDMLLAPPTPHLSPIGALALSRKLEEKWVSKEIAMCLRDIFRDHPIQVEDPEELEQEIAQRLMQIREFIRFLAASGGCEARWHVPETSEDGGA